MRISQHAVRVGDLSVFLGSEKVGIRHSRVQTAAASASRRVPGRHLLVAVLQRRLRKQSKTILKTQHKISQRMGMADSDKNK